MIHLEIISPKKVHFSDKVSEAMLPGLEGDFTAMEFHAALLSVLRPGTLIATSDEIPVHWVVHRGLCGVRENRVTVLVENCAKLAELPDEEALQATFREKSEALSKLKDAAQIHLAKDELDWIKAGLDAHQYKAQAI